MALLLDLTDELLIAIFSRLAIADRVRGVGTCRRMDPLLLLLGGRTLGGLDCPSMTKRNSERLTGGLHAKSRPLLIPAPGLRLLLRRAGPALCSVDLRAPALRQLTGGELAAAMRDAPGVVALRADTPLEAVHAHNLRFWLPQLGEGTELLLHSSVEDLPAAASALRGAALGLTLQPPAVADGEQAAALSALLPALTSLSLGNSFDENTPFPQSRLDNRPLLGLQSVAVVAQALRLPRFIRLDACTAHSRQHPPRAVIGFGDAGLAAIAASLAGCGLRALQLERNRITEAGLAPLLAALPAAHSLEALDLSRNPIQPAGLVSLAQALPRCAGLRWMRLTQILFDVLAVAALVAALPACQVEDLDLTQTGVGDDGVAQLAGALPRCGRLRNLVLSLNNLTAAAAAPLASALPACELRSLDVGLNFIGEGIVALAACLPATRLEQLSVHHCSMGPEGLQALAAALPLCPLLHTLLWTRLHTGLDDSGQRYVFTPAQEAANALFDEAVLLRNADGGSAAMINAEEV